jgi:hypothetical protein
MKNLPKIQFGLGVLFILFAFRQSFPIYVENIAEICVFLGILVSIFIAVKEKHYWMGYAMYVLALFYNPLFLIMHNINQNIVADILVGISILVIAYLDTHRLPSVISVSQEHSR